MKKSYHSVEKPYNADVVILALNRPQLTIEAAQSALSQVDVDVTVWIIDQGSELDSLALLRSFADVNKTVHLEELQENIGVAAGRNFGMSLGTADYIVSLDDDAEFENSLTLANAIEIMTGEPSLAVLTTRLINSFTGKDDYAYWAFARQLLERREETFFVTRFVGAGHIIRRTCLDEVEGYDERLFFYWEELDLAYQFINQGYRIIYAGSVRILHKHDSHQPAWLKWEGERYYYYVRNALILDYKFYCSRLRLIPLAIGYTIKGVKNHVLNHALRGVFDAVGMARQTTCNRLSQAAREYIQAHDVVHRGGVIGRIKNEVLESGVKP